MKELRNSEDLVMTQHTQALVKHIESSILTLEEEALSIKEFIEHSEGKAYHNDKRRLREISSEITRLTKQLKKAKSHG